ncbi:MAG: EamA family transporter [Ktedonobacteraceae bacterium]
MSKHLTQTHASSSWRLTRVWERLTHRTGQQSGVVSALPPPVIVLLAIISVQVGAALAKGLFQTIGSSGTVFLRVGFGALIFLLLWRPRIRGYTRADYMLLVLFGLTIACMNAAFYAAIARIPLGIAVTLEFVGPLGVSVFASRKRRDFLWAGLAAGGVVLLAPFGNTTIDPLGVVLALLAGSCWAAYILLNVRVGRTFAGGSGLALSMSVAALVMLPLGIWNGGVALLNPRILLLGVGVAILSTVIPFSLELEALRRLPARVFGVLMSLEPAIAALVGFVVLRETTGLRALIALALIVIASGGVSFFQEHDTHDLDEG